VDLKRRYRNSLNDDDELCILLINTLLIIKADAASFSEWSLVLKSLHWPKVCIYHKTVTPSWCEVLRVTWLSKDETTFPLFSLDRVSAVAVQKGNVEDEEVLSTVEQDTVVGLSVQEVATSMDFFACEFYHLEQVMEG